MAKQQTALPDLGGSGSANSDPKAAPARQEYTQAQINEMVNNPLGELWMLFGQNEATWYDGDALGYLGESNKLFTVVDHRAPTEHLSEALGRRVHCSHGGTETRRHGEEVQ